MIWVVASQALDWAIIAIEVHLMQHLQHFTLLWVHGGQIALVMVKEGWVVVETDHNQPVSAYPCNISNREQIEY